MTCHRIPGGFLCVNPWGRLRVGNRYIWVDFHRYCGPTFYTNSAMTNLYEPKDENDPVWPVFDAWRKKYEARRDKQKQEAGDAN